MKSMILILIGAIAFDGFAINKIVIPKRASPGSTITASNTNENLDTIANKVNKLIDSLDIKFPRFTDYSSGDSTLVSKRADFDTTTSDTVNITGGLKSTRATITSAGIGAETVTQSTIDSARIRDIETDTLRTKKNVADSTYTRILVAGSVIVGDTGSFPCTLWCNTYQDNGVAYYTKIGNFVSLKLPYLIGDLSAASNAEIRGIPSTIKPSSDFTISPIQINVGGAVQIGFLYIRSGSTQSTIAKSDGGRLSEILSGICEADNMYTTVNYTLY